MRITVEDGEESDERSCQGDGRAKFRHDGCTQEYCRGRNTNFHAGQRHAKQTQHSSKGHNHGESNRKYPNGRSAELCAPKADSNHSDNVVETGNGMLEAAEEANGFPFVDVSFDRLCIEEEAEQYNCETRGCFL